AALPQPVSCAVRVSPGVVSMMPLPGAAGKEATERVGTPESMRKSPELGAVSTAGKISWSPGGWEVKGTVLVATAEGSGVQAAAAAWTNTGWRRVQLVTTKPKAGSKKLIWAAGALWLTVRTGSEVSRLVEPPVAMNSRSARLMISAPGRAATKD